MGGRGVAGQEGLLGKSTITEGFLEEESAEAQTSTSTVVLRAVGPEPQAQDVHPTAHGGPP